jgi:hypothetical protein
MCLFSPVFIIPEAKRNPQIKAKGTFSPVFITPEAKRNPRSKAEGTFSPVS